MDRHEALDLLRDTHDFPGLYRFRVVARAGGAPGVISAIAATLGDRIRQVQEQPSRKGTYTSLRIEVHVEEAEEVLAVYELVGRLDEVVATL
jgi:putative lipoic acid-binding regulatory protein